MESGTGAFVGRETPAEGRPHRPVALVTGVSSGIGAAITGRLLADGWSVLGVSRREPAPAEGLEWLAADLAAPGGAAALAATVLDRHVALGAVVHAAGVQRSARLGALDAADGETMWRLHVETPAVLLDLLLPTLVTGARLVLVGSRTSTGVAGKSQYVASKSALLGMARSWAMELAERRITVNVVAPGPTDTPMLADPGRRATPPVVPPLGRLVRTEEVAAMVSLLLGEHGGAITGQQIVICGGASL